MKAVRDAAIHEPQDRLVLLVVFFLISSDAEHAVERPLDVDEGAVFLPGFVRQGHAIAAQSQDQNEPDEPGTPAIEPALLVGADDDQHQRRGGEKTQVQLVIIVEHQGGDDADEDSAGRAARRDHQVKRGQMAGVRLSPHELAMTDHRAQKKGNEIGDELSGKGGRRPLAEHGIQADECHTAAGIIIFREYHQSLSKHRMNDNR